MDKMFSKYEIYAIIDMVYARKKHGGASCYLIAPDNVAAFLFILF